MHAETMGVGQRVILIHGAMTNGSAAWSKQMALAGRWKLIVVNRPGFMPNPPADVSDFAIDAEEIAEMLDEPAHLVGHSYGGLIALLAASYRPGGVRSLALVEPAVMSLMRGDLEIERSIAHHRELLAMHSNDHQAFLAAFTASLGGDPTSVPNPLPDALRQHVQLLIHERPPWDATIPCEPLSKAKFPKLVVSGGHSQLQERMCDALAGALGPGAERAIIEGGGHIVQRTGDAFNSRLEQFFLTAD